MKKIFLIFVLVFSFNACAQDVAYNENKNDNVSVENTEEAKIDYNVSNEGTIKEITKKLLNQDKAYLATSFYYKDKVYWLAVEIKSMSEIFFYANKDLTGTKFVNKKAEGYGEGSYEYFVKNNLFKH